MSKARTKGANKHGEVAGRSENDQTAAPGPEDASRGRLPLMLTSFVGREREIWPAAVKKAGELGQI